MWGGVTGGIRKHMIAKLLMRAPVSCLVRISIAVVKHCDYKQPGEERVYFILQFVVRHPRK